MSALIYPLYLIIGVAFYSEQLTKPGIRAIEADMQIKDSRYQASPLWQRIFVGIVSFLIAVHLWPIVAVGRLWNMVRA